MEKNKTLTIIVNIIAKRKIWQRGSWLPGQKWKP